MRVCGGGRPRCVEYANPLPQKEQAPVALPSEFVLGFVLLAMEKTGGTDVKGCVYEEGLYVRGLQPMRTRITLPASRDLRKQVMEAGKSIKGWKKSVIVGVFMYVCMKVEPCQESTMRKERELGAVKPQSFKSYKERKPRCQGR